MSDVVIVGSGAAGVAAALGLARRGVRPLVIDVGLRPPTDAPRAAGNLYEYKATHDSFGLTIGGRWQGLANLLTPRPRPVKLTTPNAEYVTSRADELAPVDAEGFDPIQSFAAGGLANAWGAGLYRLTDRDLAGFPLRAAELEPFFDELTVEAGISGADDDLTPFFGSTEGLLPPIRLPANMRRIYDAYQRNRHRLPSTIRLGHPRVAVLSKDCGDRPAAEYRNLEFWQESRSIYTPRYTLDRLVADGAIDYRDGLLVERFEESARGATVFARHIDTGESVRVECKKLLLAAGAINTSKIVLAAFEDTTTRLHLFENPAVQVPFVLPRALGRRLDVEAFGLVGLNVVWDSREFGALCQGSVMEITSPMRAEFFASLPYAAGANLSLLRHLLPAMIVMQFYLPGSTECASALSLRADGRLRIEGRPNPIDLARLRPLLAFFRKLGAYTARSLVVHVPMGHAVHYAGTLPMAETPGPYQCSRHGELHGTRHVHVVDSAAFTTLPAKNMSFGMMANAMRIASHVAEELE